MGSAIFKTYFHLILAFLMLTPGLLGAKEPPPELNFSRTQMLMGHIPVTIEVAAPTPLAERVLWAMETSFSLAKQLEARWSEWNPQSEISCLNRNAGGTPCQLSPETMALLLRAIEITKKSQGAFDIRFASTTAAGRKGAIQLNWEASTATLSHPQTRIGLGGIAKGAIVDAMAEHLSQQGFDQFLINAGGDLLARGGPWPVALAIPNPRNDRITPTLSLTDQAMATSGNAEQGVHIKDPRTGKGVKLAGSVTVLAPRLEEADAWATAAWVWGKKHCEIIQAASNLQLQITWLSPQGKSHPCQSGHPSGASL